MAIDYEELEKALAEMKPRQILYELVKKEMQRRGHWKYLVRGRPVLNNLKGLKENK